jgi:hypothetical protein
MPGALRRTLTLAAAVVVAGLAGPLPVTAETDGSSTSIDDGPARTNPVDSSLIPDRARRDGRAKVVEQLKADGSSGFLPFVDRSYDYGAYRFQLVSSGSDGDVELLRPALSNAAAELTAFTNITFTLDPGQIPRPTAVNRFPPGYCGSFGGHRCSLFADGDTGVGIIRVEFASGSPCGPLAPSGVEGGVVGCGGPESASDSGITYHLRGNVWLSPSLADVNASRAGEIVAHEVGHALGLDHYEPAFTAIPGATPVRQLMYPAVHGDPSDTGVAYRSGDVQGVWWLHLPDAWYITATYRDFLGRVPDTAGYHFWVASDVTREGYVDALATSDEWIGRILTAFYQDVFGRAPDPSGLAYWSAFVRSHGVPFVASQLYGSSEYFITSGSSNTGVVQRLYRELLDRDPNADPQGVAFWVGQADLRGRVAVALELFQSDEMRRRRVEGLYCTLLDRPPDSGGLAYWAGVILQQGDLALARNLATSGEYLENSDEYSLQPLAPGPPPPGCE